MRFWKLTEALDEQRKKLWAQFRREYQITYGQQLTGPLLQRYAQIFEQKPMEEVEYYLNQIKGPAREQHKRDQEYNARQQLIQQKTDKRALNTNENTYYRVEDDVERVICSSDDPRYDKEGMPCFRGDHTDIDPELKGYYSIHVGDARGWIPILMRDGYCEEDYAYVYKIKTSELARTRTPFYSWGEDYHITNSTNTPSSDLIFSKLSIIPPQYVVLEEVIDLSDVEPAQEEY
jgi:hypothetical protein